MSQSRCRRHGRNTPQFSPLLGSRLPRGSSLRNSGRLIQLKLARRTSGEFSPIIEVRRRFVKASVHSYSDCFASVLGALRKYPKRIESYEEALAINGIGSKTAEKVISSTDQILGAVANPRVIRLWRSSRRDVFAVWSMKQTRKWA